MIDDILNMPMVSLDVPHEVEKRSHRRQNYTYNDLLDWIMNFTPEQRTSTVIVHISGLDEYLPLDNHDALLEALEDNDVLDPGTPYLVI